MRIRNLGLAAVTAALLTSACATTTSYTAVPPAPESVGIVSASIMLDPLQAPRYTRDAVLGDRANAPQITAAAVAAAPTQTPAITRAAIEAAPEQAQAIRQAVARVEWTKPVRSSSPLLEWAEVQAIVERASR